MSKTQFNEFKHDFRPCDTSRVKMVITMQDTTKLYFKPEPLKSNKSYVCLNEPPPAGSFTSSATEWEFGRRITNSTGSNCRKRRIKVGWVKTMCFYSKVLTSMASFFFFFFFGNMVLGISPSLLWWGTEERVEIRGDTSDLPGRIRPRISHSGSTICHKSNQWFLLQRMKWIHFKVS